MTYTADDGRLVTGAILKAAELVGIRPAELSRMLGVSESKISRMKSGSAALKPGAKEFELALLVLRVFRSAGALYGADFAYISDWLRAGHLDLKPTPLERMQTVSGVVDVANYLDYFRGRT